MPPHNCLYLKFHTAETKIRTSYGEFTIAGAISLRSRLRGAGVYEERADFEGSLLRKMESEFQSQVQNIEAKNRQLQSTAESMREKRETLLRELDPQIKVSNATTYIEI